MNKTKPVGATSARSCNKRNKSCVMEKQVSCIHYFHLNKPISKINEYVDQRVVVQFSTYTHFSQKQKFGKIILK